MAEVAKLPVGDDAPKAVMDAINKIGKCPEGYAWKKTETGYVCEKGGHELTFDEVEKALKAQAEAA